MIRTGRVAWVPTHFQVGDHTVQVIARDITTEFGSQTFTITVAGDMDFDGIADGDDPDRDGDGIDNASDPMPDDTDNDGVSNADDADDDDDGSLIQTRSCSARAPLTRTRTMTG